MRSAKSKKPGVGQKILGITAVLIWMAVIFFFSAQTGDVSSMTSGRLTDFLQRLFFPEWSVLSEADYAYQMAGFVFLVRKAAHFTEYLILGMLLANVYSQKIKRWSFRALFSVGTGILYAASDEIHQMFTADRSAKVFDVLVDSAGVLFGTLILLGIFAMIRCGREDRT